jgi:DNA primase
VARFTDGWLAELYSKNDIVDVISGYTTLSEKSGRLWGLCPFHHEKTPSFSVDRDKQLYYCFGCKQGGNVTNFIMKIENVSFTEAVELLAKRANIEMPKAIDDKEYYRQKEKKQSILEMNRLAARFFYDTLHSPQGRAGLEYLKKRGVDETIIKRFGLGFAPDSWSSVFDLLKAKGFSESLIRESGLVSVKNNKAFDTFRNRVMFPIMSPLSEVIAFGGRVLDDSAPKYLNSRETAVFNKRKNLYGIDIIRKMRNIKSVVLVEGYMDVVSLCAHGVKAAVASLGTALTKEQAQLLKKYTSDVYIAYDGDEAGEIATMKAIDILSAQGFKVKVMRFEEEKDPDEFIKAKGLQGFAQKVKSAPDSIAYKLDVKKKEFDISTDDGKEQYAIAASKIIEGIASPIIKERYVKRVVAETGFSADSILGQIQKKESHKNTNDNKRYNSIENNGDNAESTFLAYLLSNSRYVSDISDEIHPGDLTLSSHKNIFSALCDSAKRGIQPTYAELISELKYDEDINEAARLSNMQIVADDPRKFLSDCIVNIKTGRLVEKRQELLEKLRTARGEEIRKLLADIGELDKELQQRRLQN